METIKYIALHYLNRVRNIGRYLSLRDSLEFYTQQKQFITKEINTSKVIFNRIATRNIIPQQHLINIPYILLTPEGTLEMPMSGYYSSENPESLLPKIIDSYFNCWEFQAQTTAYIGHIPFLKAVLFRYHQTKKFEKSLEYFFDIVNAGFIINHEIVIWVLYRLLKAYEEDQSTEQFLGKFFKKNKFQNSDDWKDIKISYFFWPWGLSLNRRENAFSVILNRCLYQIECLRNSTNYDEYFNTSLHCASILLPIVRLIKSFNKKTNISLNSFIELFSEVDADCSIFRLDRERFPYELLQNFTGFLKIFRAYDPIDWENRVLEERAFVPYSIKTLFFNQQFDLLPSEWNSISLNQVMPFASLIHSDNDSTWQGLNTEDTIDVLYQIQSLKEKNDSQFLEFIDKVTQKYPYSGPLHLERAIAYDEMGYSVQALESITKSIILQRSSAMLWKSLCVILDHLENNGEAILAWEIMEELEGLDI